MWPRLPTFLLSLISSLLGPECTERLFVAYDLGNFRCLRLFLSKGLSVGIIFGAVVVKLPQILKLMLSRSSEGLSFTAYLLETMAYSVTFAYNWRSDNPFSTYGETFFITLQNLWIIGLLGLYQGRTMALMMLTAVYSVMMSTLLVPDVISPKTLAMLQALTIPVFTLSRLPQIWTTWQIGHTGQLSALTVFLVWAGSVARIYTTLQEVNDKLLMIGFLLGALLNTIVAGQMVYYWRSAKMKKE